MPQAHTGDRQSIQIVDDIELSDLRSDVIVPETQTKSGLAVEVIQIDEDAEQEESEVRERISIDIKRSAAKVVEAPRRHSISYDHDISSRVRNALRKKKQKTDNVLVVTNDNHLNVLHEPHVSDLSRPSLEQLRDMWATKSNAGSEPILRFNKLKSVLRRDSRSIQAPTVGEVDSYNAERVESKTIVDQTVHNYFKNPSLFAVVSNEDSNSMLVPMTSEYERPRYLLPVSEHVKKKKTGKKQAKPHLLNGFDGVFVPCVASTIGTILFLKVPWILGQAGTGYSLLYVLISSVLAILTWTSMSAIATNGFLPHGGPYYMVSRTLGPKFGGSVGLIYVLGFVWLCSLHVFAAGELLHSFLHKVWHGMRLIDPNASKPYWDLILFGIVFLFIVYIAVSIGIRVIAKFELAFLLLAGLCIIFIVIGCFETHNMDINAQGPSWKRFKRNWGPSFSKGQDFFSVMALLIPGVTGILAGINRSGDLKNPTKSIPQMTFASIIFTQCIYILLIISFAFSGDRTVLKAKEIDYSSMIAFPYQKHAAYYIVEIGILFVILAEAMQALLVGPRIFQALAADRVIPIPKLEFFAKIKWGEPRRATLAITLIAILPLFLGNLERIAVLIAMFLLLCFSFINLACFITGWVKSPSWRPAFRIYHWGVSLCGFIATTVVMFLISWYWALLAFFCASAVYLLIAWKGPVSIYGDGITGLKIQSALSSLYEMIDEPEHTKNWRPQFLVLVKLLPNGTPEKPEILNFIHHMKKARGLCIVAAILEGVFVEKHGEAKLLKQGLRMKLRDMKLRAFPYVICSPTYSDGVRFLIQYSGVGTLTPNTVVTYWPNNWQENQEDCDHMVEILDYSEYTGKTVVVCRGLESFPTNPQDMKRNDTIDVFWIAHDGGVMVMLAYLLKQHKVWRKCKLRIFTVIDKSENRDAFKKKLKSLLDNLRIDAQAEVLVCDHDTLNPYTYDSKELKDRRKHVMKKMKLSKVESQKNLDELYDTTGIQVDSDEESDQEDTSTIISFSNLRHKIESRESLKRSQSLVKIDESRGKDGGEIALVSPSFEKKANRSLSLGSINIEGLATEEVEKVNVPDPADTSNENPHHVVQIDPVEQIIIDDAVYTDDQETANNYQAPSCGELLDTSVTMNRIILEQSRDAKLVIINLPHNIPTLSTPEYMEILEALTLNIERCLLVRGGGGEVITWYA